ncbi:MAG: coenzyme biosynthesis protein PqqD [Chloroflexi bacterium]|jgi:coenzyme PQQ biosynthesis protein PqqD|nr:coenzyme biosynthesis protein PqqD [Chloroflexota bacterium]MDB5074719.1 coenzyme biosynthesis protein PqqD [Chloroflexota bacterium]
MSFGPEDVPSLAARTRLRHDAARDTDVLLYPEGVLVLNGSAGAILAECDGKRNVAEISAILSQHFGGIDVMADVIILLERLETKGLVVK